MVSTVPVSRSGTAVMTEFTRLGEPSVNSMDAFVATLESVRAASAPDAWRDRVRTDPALRLWRYFLAHDPYTRWGMIKPRGYPGDACLMDFAYGHQSISAHIDESSRLGRELYAYTSAAPQSESARLRIVRIAAIVQQMIATNGGLSIVSFASGYCREIESLPADAKASVSRICALDLDSASLALAESAVAPVTFKAVRCNVIKDDLSAVPRAQLVYSLGLFDYLASDVASRVLAKMWAATSAGGTCIVANLATSAANLGYCEAIMDWWMIPRTESEMRSLGEGLAVASSDVASITVERTGCFYFLSLVKSER